MKLERLYLNSLLAALFVLSSCKNAETYIPTTISEVQPSWDGLSQNSGIVDFIKDEGFLISKSAAARYTFLTEKFGAKLTPPVVAGEGLIEKNEKYILSPEYMSVFMEVSRLNKQ